MQARTYIDQLTATGRYTFTTEAARQALGGTGDAVKLALNRLRRRGEIASPVRGFWVIVPPEYLSLGCLPAEQFVPALMAHLGTAYYGALLSAAQFHGAAHHRPQTFQVMVEKPRRAIVCGKVRVDFHVRKQLSVIPLQNINTPRDTVVISTPAATAYDLIGYESQIGGLNAVATVLADLAEKLDPTALTALAPQMPMPWVQRLGFVLEQLDEPNLADPLKAYVGRHARIFALLQPATRHDHSGKQPDWKLLLNAELEPET